MSYNLFYQLSDSTDEERLQILDDIASDDETYYQLIDSMFRDISQKQRIRELENIFPDMNERQKIYLQIILTDRNEQTLNNEWLYNTILEAGLDEPDYMMYELANRAKHEYIYLPSTRDIDSYSINLLWVNRLPQNRDTDEAEHIFGDGLSDETLNTFIDRLSTWRTLNPNADISLWFDSALVTETAYLNTRDILDEFKIRLRDIRSLTNIPELIQLSLHPMTHI